MRIEWSARSVSDLKSISEYVEQDRNLDIANRTTRSIYDAVQSLLKMPYRGRYGRVEGTRELVIPRLPSRNPLMELEIEKIGLQQA